MSSNPIQWFPGHIAKTRRVMKECLPQVDLVLELLDSRIPKSSKNPEIEKLLEGKPRITVLTKSSLANPDVTARFATKYNADGVRTVVIDAVTDVGIPALSEAVREVMSDKLERYKAKGMDGRKLRAMIVGIPNVGKSSLINRLAGGKRAKVENRPGVTLARQWVPTEIGENLAFTGAIRDQILDTEEIAMLRAGRLASVAPRELCERYKLDPEDCESLDCYDLFRLIGKKRGFLISGGEINHERTATMLLEEFRSGKIGRISLELP